MTGAFKFLLCLSLLLAAAHGIILNTNDFQTCMDLCASCEGKSSFENGICKCSFQEDGSKNLECVMRLQRNVEDLGLESASDDADIAERSARCSLLGLRRRIGSGDADRVASYFMNGGPIAGTSLLGKPNSDCATSSGDPVTGAINPTNAKPRPAEPEVEKTVGSTTVKSPVVAAPTQACSSSQYQPIVSSSWIPNYNAGYSPIIGAPQPYQTSFYPHMLGAIPHMVMAIPNAVMRAASHIPSHNSGMLGASHHSPILASLASGTHGVLRRLDKMVSSYAPDDENKIVGAPQHKPSDCQRSSHPSYPNSIMVGAPAPDSSQINAAMLQKVLADQNSLLESLSLQLESLSPQVGAPRIQYATVAPTNCMLGAPYPISQYPPQPIGQYVQQQQPICYYSPGGSSTSSSSPKAAESAEKPAEAKETEKEEAAKDAENKEAPEDKVESPAENETPKKDTETETNIEETKKSEEEESQKTKRENRSRSTNRKKRGDVKYVKKSETHV